jgi:hypothetical protein
MKVAVQELGRRLVPPTDHERQVIFEQIRTKVSLFSVQSKIKMIIT